MTNTSGGSSASSSRGASRSLITTSASASSWRPRTVIRPGSPGPPSTSATPGVWRRKCLAEIVPAAIALVMALRVAAEHADADVGGGAGGGCPGRRGGRVVGSDAPGALSFRLFGHPRVNLRRTRAGADQPGAGAVALAIGPATQAD